MRKHLKTVTFAVPEDVPFDGHLAILIHLSEAELEKLYAAILLTAKAAREAQRQIDALMPEAGLRWRDDTSAYVEGTGKLPNKCERALAELREQANRGLGAALHIESVLGERAQIHPLGEATSKRETVQ
ncbi:MAG: hypothetical protein ACXIUV_06480 [Alkalilacustris sp.]